MLYRSTAGKVQPATLREAVWHGLAPDGGLYQPERILRREPSFWQSLAPMDLAATAVELLAPYVERELNQPQVRQVASEALDFSIPLVRLEPNLCVLELFHGPTLAFKDVGARFLARLYRSFREPGEGPVTVLVATSGDTGGAVADAFHGLEGVRVVVLYPHQQVSPRQERQFATLGGNVQALAVRGTFDDCQRLAKEAFAEPGLAEGTRLTSANSINIGRLLPQTVYYAHAWAQLGEVAESPVFCTPSGNLGNLTAGLLAQRMGLPCSGFVVAVNANRVVPEFLATGEFTPRPSLATLANAMDVGNPSNLARIRDLFDDDLGALRETLWASSHADEEIRGAIRDVHQRTGRVLDPHTAVGYQAVRRYRREVNPEVPIVLLATAHPAKFGEVVEPILEESLPLPPQLAACLERPLQREIIPPELSALTDRLLESGGQVPLKGRDPTV
jgi:threonine synthase